jgi:hypothetical protein
METSNQNPAPVAEPTIASGAAQAPVTKKTSPWVWIIGGCLTIIILGGIVTGVLLWWGYRTAKKTFKEQAPQIQEFKGKLEEMNAEAEKWNQEADQWERKSQEMRDLLPNPEDLEIPAPALH